MKKISVVSFFIFGMIIASSLMAQQTAQSSNQRTHEAVSTTELEPQEVAINVGNKICPVSGEKVNEKMKVTYEYESKVYNFCCPMCIDEFKKGPQEYIKKAEKELQAAPEAEATMHESHTH